MDKLASKIIIGFLLIFNMTISEKGYTKNNQLDFDYVKYGISFGESEDHYNMSIQISESKINFEKSGRDLDNKSPDILISEIISNEYWLKLVGVIDFESFIQLESTMNIDSDTEWIEIKNNDKIYKVSFEYGKEPEILKGYIGFLRTYMASFKIDLTENVNFDERTLINKEGKVKIFHCSRGCMQYVIELNENNKSTFYFDKYLDSKYKKDGLSILFNGVIQFDSTVINKPGPNDVPTPDFNAKNIRLINVNINSD